jgi:hypothetical protein
MLNDAEFTRETGIDPLELGESEFFTWFLLDMREAHDPQTGEHLCPSLRGRVSPIPLWEVRRIPHYEGRLSKRERGITGPFGLPVEAEAERLANVEEYRRRVERGEPIFPNQ